jgi:hypothetical protein
MSQLKAIQQYARTRLADLADQPFFRTLASDLPPSRTLQILPYVTFWSMVFQDIIALNLARVSDPRLHEIVQTHYDEDVGHNLWLAEDLRLIYGELPDVLTVFDAQYLEARAVSYAFMAEVERAESDWERVTLPIVLEEGGQIFLPALIQHFSRVGLGPHLRALGQKHVDTEAAHEIHGAKVAAQLRSVDLTDHARARSIAMIERAHATFLRFARVLDRVITTSTPEREAPIARRLVDIDVCARIGSVTPG